MLMGKHMNDKEDKAALTRLSVKCREALRRQLKQFPELSVGNEKTRRTGTGGFWVWCATFELKRAQVYLDLWFDQFVRFDDDPKRRQRHLWFGVACESPQLIREIAAELEEQLNPITLRQQVTNDNGFTRLKKPVGPEFAGRTIKEVWDDEIYLGVYDRHIPDALKELGATINRIVEFWRHVMAAVRAAEADDEQMELEKAMEGQGFGRTAAERRAIENRALVEARRHFEKEGFVLKKVFRTGPYDLEFIKGKTVLHVEVKGTTTNGKTIILTRGEVDYHRDRPKGTSSLFVLHSIKLRNGKASGGQKHWHYPWSLKADGGRRLSPVCFTYAV